uniref:TOG domain-containing protein n=1 Tax=Trichuris muris TaxID=70415 RepID=A0A5S6QE89_TRIMR
MKPTGQVESLADSWQRGKIETPLLSFLASRRRSPHFSSSLYKRHARLGNQLEAMIESEEPNRETGVDVPLCLEQVSVDQLLSILSDGNEIQRICLVRSLPGLMANKADLLIKVFLLLQKILCSSTCNLDMQFETCDVFRIIAQNAGSSKENVCRTVLKSTFKIIDAQDSVIRAAWMEMLLDLAEELAPAIVLSDILPEAVSRCQCMRSPQTRLFGGRLLGKIASRNIIPDGKGKVLPLVQSLCHDNDPAIRAVACMQLQTIANFLSPSAVQSVVLPLLMELSKDEDKFVREADFETLVFFLPQFEQETCSSVLMPSIEKFANEALQAMSGSGMLAIAGALSTLIQVLTKNPDNKRIQWLLTITEKLSFYGTETRNDTDCMINEIDAISRQIEPGLAASKCRRAVAASIPEYTKLLPLSEFKRSLLPIYRQLCQDTDCEVQKQSAIAFPVIATYFGKAAEELVDCLIDLIYSGDTDVIEGLTKNLGKALQCMYTASAGASANVDISSRYSIPSKITRILLACNRLTHNTSNWRCHENYLLALATLTECIPEDMLVASFFPVIKDEILHVRAWPCRIASIRTFMTWTNSLKNPTNIRSSVEFLTTTLATHPSYSRRMLFLECCFISLGVCPKDFFKQNLLPTALKLAQDPVKDVRYRLCILLPNFKAALQLPEEADLLGQMEATLKSITFNKEAKSCVELHQKVCSEFFPPVKAAQKKSDTASQPVPAKQTSRKVASVSPTMANKAKAPKDEVDRPKLTPNQSLSPVKSSNETVRSVAPVTRGQARKTAVVQPQQFHRDPSPRPTNGVYERLRSPTISAKDSAKASSPNQTKEARKPKLASRSNTPAEEKPSIPTHRVNPVAKPPSESKASEGATVKPVHLMKGGPNGKRIVVKPAPVLKPGSLGKGGKPPKPPAVICTGSVMKSIAKFEENLIKHKESTKPPIRLHYSKKMNQSFSAFPSRQAEVSKETAASTGRKQEKQTSQLSERPDGPGRLSRVKSSGTINVANLCSRHIVSPRLCTTWAFTLQLRSIGAVNNDLASA